MEDSGYTYSCDPYYEDCGYSCDPYYEECTGYYDSPIYNKGTLHVMVWTALAQWSLPMMAFDLLE